MANIFSIETIAKIVIKKEKVKVFLEKLKKESLLTSYQQFDWLYLEYLCSAHFEEIWQTRYVNSVKTLPADIREEAQEIFGLPVE